MFFIFGSQLLVLLPGTCAVFLVTILLAPENVGCLLRQPNILDNWLRARYQRQHCCLRFNWYEFFPSVNWNILCAASPYEVPVTPFLPADKLIASASNNPLSETLVSWDWELRCPEGHTYNARTDRVFSIFLFGDNQHSNCGSFRIWNFVKRPQGTTSSTDLSNLGCVVTHGPFVIGDR